MSWIKLPKTYRILFRIQLDIHTASCVNPGDKYKMALTEHNPNLQVEKYY